MVQWWVRWWVQWWVQWYNGGYDGGYNGGTMASTLATYTLQASSKCLQDFLTFASLLLVRSIHPLRVNA